jgi:predicted RNase H-like HicB family nuclease
MVSKRKPFPYPVLTGWSSEDKVFLAIVPALIPLGGVRAHGNTMENAVHAAQVAGQLVLDVADSVPPPENFDIPAVERNMRESYIVAFSDGTHEEVEVIDVMKAIKIVPIIDTKQVHTDGMAQFDKPDLEIVDIPSFMYPDAAFLLNNLADFILNGGEKFKVNERVQIGPSIFRLALSPNTCRGNVMWRLEEMPGAYQCAHCGGSHKKHSHEKHVPERKK